MYAALGEVLGSHRSSRRCPRCSRAGARVLRAEGQRRVGRALARGARRAPARTSLVDSAGARLSELRSREPRRLALLRRVRNRARHRRAGARAAQGRHGSLLRPRRLDSARRVDGSRSVARAHAAVLRGSSRRSSSGTAGRSRSSSATRSWRCSASRSRTRTTRCERFGRPRRCGPRSSEHGLEARIGINTGEVVVGGEWETLVTGDAVNVAARLEQSAVAAARRSSAPRRELSFATPFGSSPSSHSR